MYNFLFFIIYNNKYIYIYMHVKEDYQFLIYQLTYVSLRLFEETKRMYLIL